MDSAPDVLIRSADNRIPKLVRSLRQRKSREAERLFVVEGVRHVEDALASGGVARIVLLREGTDWQAPSHPGHETEQRTVAATLFDQLSSSVAPQPLMAIFEYPTIAIADRPDPLVLVVDGVRDPGNLGTMLRSAAAADATCVLVAKGTVDPYNEKVVRAAMGAHFRVALRWLNQEMEEWVGRACPARVAADTAGERLYWDYDWRGGTAIIVGGEAFGVSERVLDMATAAVRIPVARSVESLNAAVAASVLLFEAVRQRGTPQ